MRIQKTSRRLLRCSQRAIASWLSGPSDRLQWQIAVTCEATERRKYDDIATPPSDRNPLICGIQRQSYFTPLGDGINGEWSHYGKPSSASDWRSKAVQSVLHMSASGHERTKSDIPATSDLPSTSEMIRDRPHDRNVPFPDKRIANELLLDHLVSLSEQCGWYGEA